MARSRLLDPVTSWTCRRPSLLLFHKIHSQVWEISETHDQNYRSNARPRLRLADLLTEVVILQLSYCIAVLSDRNLIIGLSLPVSADSIDLILFSDAIGPRGEKLDGKQTKFSGKNHQIEPSSDRNPYFFFLPFLHQFYH